MGKFRSYFLCGAILTALLSACGSKSAEESNLAAPEQAALKPLFDTVYLKKAELVEGTTASNPSIRLQGIVPTPCQKLLVKLDEISQDIRIQIILLSTVDLKTVCSQELQPFDQTIRISGLQPGTYSVWASIGEVGEYTVQ